MSDLGEKLAQAMQGRQIVEDVTEFVWKGEKQIDDNGRYKQNVIRLVDATDEELQKFNTHCHTMLYNNSSHKPGRIPLLKEIADQRNRCGVELFYRESKEKGITAFSIVDSIRTAISKANLSPLEVEDLVLGTIVNIDSDFATLPITLVIDGGIDRLGWFNKNHLTLAFILRQGVWLSEEEKRELSKILTFPFNKRIELIKTTLKVPETMRLEFNPVTGLSIREMQAMLTLQSKKYSHLTTEQLSTLRYKVLFSLEDQVNLHISQWNERKRQIRLVAEYKNIKL